MTDKEKKTDSIHSRKLPDGPAGEVESAQCEGSGNGDQQARKQLQQEMIAKQIRERPKFTDRLTTK